MLIVHVLYWSSFSQWSTDGRVMNVKKDIHRNQLCPQLGIENTILIQLS